MGRSYDAIIFISKWSCSHWKCTEHVAASNLYKNKLLIFNAASFYVHNLSDSYTSKNMLGKKNVRYGGIFKASKKTNYITHIPKTARAKSLSKSYVWKRTLQYWQSLICFFKIRFELVSIAFVLCFNISLVKKLIEVWKLMLKFQFLLLTSIFPFSKKTWYHTLYHLYTALVFTVEFWFY